MTGLQMLARFVIRPDKTDSSSGGLMIGLVVLNHASELLKAGVIYEIREMLGTLQIVPLGPAAIHVDHDKTLTRASWSWDVADVIESGKDWILTQDEIRSVPRAR